MPDALPTIAILGASGLIGQALAEHLMLEGYPVVAMARRLTQAQTHRFGATAIEAPIMALDASGLARIIRERHIDMVVNCIGVLQDGPRGKTEAVHVDFVRRLTEAMALSGRAPLLLHLSVPGDPDDDATAFSRTKREAERVIAESGLPFVVLRPGFVIAPAAYGGSALIRALAALPLDLPASEASRTFAATAISDIGRTVSIVARRWQTGERHWRASYDVMERNPTNVGGVVAAFRARFGGPAPRLTLPAFLLGIGARFGDAAARLGWAPPVRSTALAELRRGVAGDPSVWSAETGIEPLSLDEALRRVPATVQEGWFGRLYLAKALIFGSLALFWLVSGLVALTVSFDAASAILMAQGMPKPAADMLTVATSLADIAIGGAIAWRRWSRAGLIAGIGLTVGYLAGSVMIAPQLWLDPVGSMVKTVPAAMLMLVALAILDDR
ncbi:SDR family oxidoreductase [Phreatobacter aquaticus]|uniref:SDR family oxidoreductase n=1 Tax=Phreatobacter aquaticus TaxID=2570229 RepID=A0A4D7QK65_9HYPH|nr:SDR family oxidoreductase [Phreatobacter aquaticus]QCK87011.1 SDR family oxidoreductase [Phreatobacter aquaticus]